MLRNTEEVTGTDVIYSNTNPFNIYQSEGGMLCVNFELNSPATISLSLYDLNGRELQSFVQNQVFSSGAHTTTWNLPNTGGLSVCLVKYIVNGNLNIKKIQIK